MLDLKRPPAIHRYDGVTRTVFHTQGTLYRTRRPWHRYLRTIASAIVITALGTWALTEAVTWAVDTFLLPGGMP